MPSGHRKQTSAEGPTIRDVAQLADVSIGTVSRVINKHKSVRDVVRSRVLEAITELGYQPNRAAQSMRLGATHTVACVTRDISIPGFGRIVRGTEQVLREQSYTLLLAITDESKEREMNLLRMFSQRRVDAIIMTTTSERDDALCEYLEKLNLPIVLLDRDVPAALDAVVVDHRAGVQAATEYLVGLKHTRIALITGQPVTRPASERIAGFKEGIAGHEEAEQQSLVRAVGFSAEAGFLETSALLASENRPTAIIAGGMAMLPGVMQAVRARNLRIPEDLSIIAGADTDLAALAQPAVTAIRWNEIDIGRLSAQLLVNRLDGQLEKTARRVVIPTELVARRSCAAPFEEGKGRKPRGTRADSGFIEPPQI